MLAAIHTGGIPQEEFAELLDLTDEELERMYDRLLSAGVLKVVKIRRIVGLTPKGTAYVERMMRQGLL